MQKDRLVCVPRLALLALLLPCVLVACKREPAVPADVAEPSSGVIDVETVPADDARRPELKVTTLDGDAYDLADHRGKWVVVNFWATWCKPCLKEMPELSALDAMREYIEVIGLAYEEIEAGEMRTFLEKHPVVYPIAIIDTYDPPADFETPRGLPMTYLIAPDGRVAERFLGPVTARDLETAIARATDADAGDVAGEVAEAGIETATD